MRYMHVDAPGVRRPGYEGLNEKVAALGHRAQAGKRCVSDLQPGQTLGAMLDKQRPGTLTIGHEGPGGTQQRIGLRIVELIGPSGNGRGGLSTPQDCAAAKGAQARCQRPAQRECLCLSSFGQRHIVTGPGGGEISAFGMAKQQPRARSRWKLGQVGKQSRGQPTQRASATSTELTAGRGSTL